MDELLDHLPIGYFRIRLLYDDNGRATDYLFLSVNQTAQQILGVDASDYLDKTAREIDLPVDQHIDELAAIGITMGQIRLSSGLEDTDDLLNDFDQALAKM